MSFLRSAIGTLCVATSWTNVSYEQIRHIKRWVAPTLKELRRRKEKAGPDPITRRSSFLEWNYNAELYAFGYRLHEEFDVEALQRAFVHKSYIMQENLKQKNVGIEDPLDELEHNDELVKRGETIVSNFVTNFLTTSLPRLPSDGLDSIKRYLTSEEVLAHTSQFLGTKDLILSADFPVEKSTLCNTLLAIIAVLEDSSGKEKANLFVKDFICTQLNQKDLLEIWEIQDPFKRLEDYCTQNKIGIPEPRLLGEVGRNTCLAAYYVGIYVEKKMIGKGFGEDLSNAISMAALDALMSFFGIKDNMKPFDYDNCIVDECQRKEKAVFEE